MQQPSQPLTWSKRDEADSVIAQLAYEMAQFVAQMIVIIACIYVVLGVDDMVFDATFWIASIRRWVRMRGVSRLTVAALRDKPQQRIAIMIPCWNEAEVVDRMLEFAVRTIDYDRYTIFVGIYPNDAETIAKVQRATAELPHVVAAVNVRPGPTTKADNLNNMYRIMREYEGSDPFEAIVLHDVEDVIHPLELRLYNLLLPRNAMVQLPVLPLERPWHKWTAWTYGDEFAENHLKDLVVREVIGSFVPSAGVATGFSREALDRLESLGESIFSTESLTEDYQIGLRLRLHGFKTIFVHQRLATKHTKMGAGSAGAYVATRAYFPDTLQTAVRQKARWVVGICFQAWRDLGWQGDFFNRYTLYRDRKAIVSNVITLVGYAVMALGFALIGLHRVFEWVPEPLVPVDAITVSLLAFTFSMTVFRMAQRAYFVTSMYGPLQGLLTIVRFPWGSLINALATMRAGYLVLKAQIQKKAVVWHKTAHAFPTDTALTTFKQQLGEVLLASGRIDREQLEIGLREQRATSERLGATLIRLAFANENDVRRAIESQHSDPFKRQIGDILIERGVITHGQLEEALRAQRATVERLGSTLVRLGFISARDVDEAVGMQALGDLLKQPAA